MAEYLVTTEELELIADTIREKGKTSSSLTFPNDFVTAILEIDIEPEVSGATVEKITGTQDDYTLIMESAGTS